MLTRKDFVFSAELISKITNKAEKLIAYARAAELFKKSNPRFDETKFRQACGL